MELASPPKFKRTNTILLLVLIAATAVILGLGVTADWWEQGHEYLGSLYAVAAIVAFIAAIVGIPFSLAGLVCSRRELRAILIAGMNCLASIAVLAMFVSSYFAINDRLRDIYGSASAARLVIEHLRMNDGMWPRNWDELHETYLVLEQRGEALDALG